MKHKHESYDVSLAHMIETQISSRIKCLGPTLAMSTSLAGFATPSLR